VKRNIALILAIVLVTLALVGCGQKTDDAPTELRPVTFVFPRTLEVLEDTPFWAAKVLGYFEEEGLDVNFEQAFGTTDLRMVATGQAEFACPGPSFTLAAIEEGVPVKVVMAYDAINIWGMCVLTNGPIQSFDDMIDAQAKHGRRLTVALGDASWEMLVVPTLIAAGINPDEDLEFVVAGEGRFIQVAEGNIDMLFSWPGEAWQLMGQNFDFIYIDGNDVLQTVSNSIITNLDLIENEPEVVAGFVRALAKGMYFTQYNFEAAAAVSTNQFPAIDITWNAAVGVQEGRAYQMFGPKGGQLEAQMLDNIGWNWENKWDLVMDSAVESEIISAPIPLDRVFTNEFIDSTWDRAAVRADADNFDIESARSRYALD